MKKRFFQKIFSFSGIKRERKILKISESEVGRSQKNYINLFKICDAIWSYNGNPQSPHVLLTSGYHSDGYVNCPNVLKFPNLKRILAKRLVKKFLKLISKSRVDYVVSSAMAAIPFGDEVASLLNAAFIYCEKEKGIQKLKRFKIPDKARILQVEELITSLKTTRQVKKAILENNPRINWIEINGKPVVLALIHRPPKLPIEYPNYNIISLIELEIHNWKPEKCPLCKAGSQPLKPKENWQDFLKFNKF